MLGVESPVGGLQNPRPLFTLTLRAAERPIPSLGGDNRLISGASAAPDSVPGIGEARVPGREGHGSPGGRGTGPREGGARVPGRERHGSPGGRGTGPGREVHGSPGGRHGCPGGEGHRSPGGEGHGSPGGEGHRSPGGSCTGHGSPAEECTGPRKGGTGPREGGARVPGRGEARVPGRGGARVPGRERNGSPGGAVNGSPGGRCTGPREGGTGLWEGGARVPGREVHGFPGRACGSDGELEEFDLLLAFAHRILWQTQTHQVSHLDSTVSVTSAPAQELVSSYPTPLTHSKQCLPLEQKRISLHISMCY